MGELVRTRQPDATTPTVINSANDCGGAAASTSAGEYSSPKQGAAATTGVANTQNAIAGVANTQAAAAGVANTQVAAAAKGVANTQAAVAGVTTTQAAATRAE